MQRYAILLGLLLPVTVTAQDSLGGNGGGLRTRPAIISSVVPADEAFALEPILDADGELVLDWRILPDYYLYRQSIAVLDANGNRLDTLKLPAGSSHTDEFFGAVDVFYGMLQVRLPTHALVTEDGDELQFSVQYQGCAEERYCYPLQIREFSLPAP